MKLRKVLIPFAILMLFAPTVAFASTTTPIVTNLNSGALSITPPTVASPFTGTVLNGQVQTTQATLSSWNVTDATGTGDGWNVTLSASQFTEIAPSTGFASGTSAFTLPSGSLALAGSRTVTASSGATPVSSTNGPYFSNQTSTIDTGSPIQILTALTDYGMGSYNITEPTNGLLLTLQPSTTKVDLTNYPSSPTPYQSTLTWTVASGPQATPPYTLSPSTGAITTSTVFTLTGANLPILSSTGADVISGSGGGLDYGNFLLQQGGNGIASGTFTSPSGQDIWQWGSNGVVTGANNSQSTWGINVISSTPTELQFTIALDNGISYDTGPWYVWLNATNGNLVGTKALNY